MNNAFKEWTLICDALGSGRQTLILRKGGIAEGRDGFAFKAKSFYLFPTLFHEQVAKLRVPPETPLLSSAPGHIAISLHATIIHTSVLSDWAVIQGLEPFHIWKPEVIRERFEYDGRHELHLAVVRAARMSPAWMLEDSPKFGGCRSWVELPTAPADAELEPVLDDATFEARLSDILGVLPADQPA